MWWKAGATRKFQSLHLTPRLLPIPTKKLRHASMRARPPLYTSTCRNSRRHHHLEILRHVMLPIIAKFCEVLPVSERVCGKVSEYDLHVSRDGFIIGCVPLALVCHRELPLTASLRVCLLAPLVIWNSRLARANPMTYCVDANILCNYIVVLYTDRDAIFD